MEDVAFLSIDDKNEADPTLSNNNDIGDVEKSCNVYNALLDKLEEKTGDFMKVICAKQTVKNKNGAKFSVKLSEVAHNKFEAFITSADNIIKWYEADNSRLEAIVDNLLNEVTASNQARKSLTKKLNSKIVTKQNDTITALEQTVYYYEVKTKAMNEKIQQMKAVQNEMQKRIVELEQKEAESKECIRKSQAQVIAGNFQVEVLKTEIKEKDVRFRYMMQKFEETISQGKNYEDQQRIAQAKMIGKEVQIAQMNEEIAKLTAKVNERDNTIQKLENEVRQLAEENAKLLDPTQFCTTDDVVVKGEIDYELLNGKIWLIKDLRYEVSPDGAYMFSANGWEICWLTLAREFRVCPNGKLVVFDNEGFTYFLDRIICNKLRYLVLFETILTYSEYKKLTSSNQLSCLKLDQVTVNDENGIRVEIDKLLKEVKNGGELNYTFCDGEVTSETAHKLAELPPFPNLYDFYLQNIQECFDLYAFGNFLKKNPTITFCFLSYKCSDKFYEEIQRARNDLVTELPSTCYLSIH